MRFKIYSPEGHLLYEGEPSYNGAYMKPGTLTFRRICNPTTIPFQVGCYVDYTFKIDGTETRTGYRYFMLTLPQLKKTARPRKAGDAFEYESVVFYDASKVLDFLPFEDLVISDNRQHFSTQESFSTFEAVDGIARRIQSCLDAAYPGLWTVQVSSNPELASLMAEAREFSVSGGISLLGALERIYEVWPEVGWLFEPLPAPDHLEMGGVITIGAPGLAGQDYIYGKGKGLKSIQRAVANEGEIVNRLYAYGSERNLPPRYYNGKDIYLKDSADIRNLMIPILWWGSEGTPSKKSPLKAYLSNFPSILANGLRPKRVYFDGKNDLEEIYPTIKGMTVGDLREYEDEGGVVDYPAGLVWQDSAPLDQIWTVRPDPDGLLSEFDNGLTGEDGKIDLLKAFFDHSIDTSTSTNLSNAEISLAQDSFGLYPPPTASDAKRNASVDISKMTFILSASRPPSTAKLSVRFYKRTRINPVTTHLFTKDYPMHVGYDGTNYTFEFLEDNPDYAAPTIVTTPEFDMVDQSEYVMVSYYLVLDSLGSGMTIVYYEVYGQSILSYRRNVIKNFMASIPPFGYDLKNIVATEDTVRIAMTSGPCAGREFVVKNTSLYTNGNSNMWWLTLERQYDESLSQYFPNYDYPIEPDDTFVILGIAMPEVYINAAEQRLLLAANKYLQAYSNVMWQYSPEIDSKYMIEQKRRIFPGQYMVIVDYDLVDEAGVGELAYFLDSTGGYFLTENNEKIIVNESGFAVSILVDNITIDEAAGALPSYKVTLRDRKRLKR